MPKIIPSPAVSTALDELRQTVQLSLSVDRTVLARVTKYRREKGLPFEQDVIRLALVTFLEKQGY